MHNSSLDWHHFKTPSADIPQDSHGIYIQFKRPNDRSIILTLARAKSSLLVFRWDSRYSTSGRVTSSAILTQEKNCLWSGRQIFAGSRYMASRATARVRPYNDHVSFLRTKRIFVGAHPRGRPDHIDVPPCGDMKEHYIVRFYSYTAFL